MWPSKYNIGILGVHYEYESSCAAFRVFHSKRELNVENCYALTYIHVQLYAIGVVRFNLKLSSIVVEVRHGLHHKLLKSNYTLAYKYCQVVIHIQG